MNFSDKGLHAASRTNAERNASRFRDAESRRHARCYFVACTIVRAPGINRLPSSTKGARCCPANEVQHENISSRRKEPPWRSLTGARRSRCPAVKLRALAIKPNVNCVIAPRRGSVLGTRGGRDRAISCFLTARIPFLSSRCYPFPLRPRRARGNSKRSFLDLANTW